MNTKDGKDAGQGKPGEVAAAPAAAKTAWDHTAEKLGGTSKRYRARAKEILAIYPQGSAEEAEAKRLTAFADELDKLGVSTEVDLAKQHMQMRGEDWLKARQHQRDWVIENTRQTVQLGLSAIRTTVLINGGALVALLAFLGNVWARSGPVAAFSGAFQWFASGLLLATVTLAFSYAAQFCYGYSDDDGNAMPRWLKIGKVFHVGALVLFVVALAAFARGCFASFDALRTAEPPPASVPSQETASVRPQTASPAAQAAPTNQGTASQGTGSDHVDAAPSVTSQGPAAAVSPSKEVTPTPPTSP